jgi:hypothetical protein
MQYVRFQAAELDPQFLHKSERSPDRSRPRQCEQHDFGSNPTEGFDDCIVMLVIAADDDAMAEVSQRPDKMERLNFGSPPE